FNHLVNTGETIRNRLNAAQGFFVRDASAADQLRGQGGGLVGQRGGEDEVAILQRLLRLLSEPLRLIVLGARVGAQPPVVDAAKVSRSTSEGVAHLFFRGGIACR